MYGWQSSQEVCPFNRKFSEVTDEPAFWPRSGVHGTELVELMSLPQEKFSRRFKGSPVKRAKRRGLLRNVAVALGNWGSPEAIPVLSDALDDDEPLVRGHAAWALGRVAGSNNCSNTSAARVGEVLPRRFLVEEDEWVREELSLALSN